MNYAKRKVDHPPYGQYKPVGTGTSICLSNLAQTRRYCEGCHTYKPKTTAPAVKGWRCHDCKTKGATA